MMLPIATRLVLCMVIATQSTSAAMAVAAAGDWLQFVGIHLELATTAQTGELTHYSSSANRTSPPSRLM